MTISEHLASLRKSREDAKEKLLELAQKSMDEGRSMNDAEQAESDELKKEIDTFDGDIKRFSELETMAAEQAEDVTAQAQKTASQPAKPGEGKVFRTAKSAPKLDDGIAFARAAKCLALGTLEHRDARQIAKEQYGENEKILAATARLVTKASVDPATTSDDGWAGALVSDEGGAFADFIEYLRPMTILGKFGRNNVPGLRAVPFRTRLVGQTSGGDGYWVGEAKAKPLTKFDFGSKTVEPLKVANIAAASMEVLRDSSPAADALIRDQLAEALAERLDKDFIDPDNAGTSGTKPASITNGASGTDASGTDSDALIADVKTLFNTFIDNNNAPTSGVWIMSNKLALALSLMQNALGQPEFPGITMNGGTFHGLPVIASQYVPQSKNTAGDDTGETLILANARDIYLGDNGDIDVSMSTEASLEMSDSPTGSGSLVSLWQQNLVGFRAERTINWALRRDNAVAYIQDANYG